MKSYRLIVSLDQMVLGAGTMQNFPQDSAKAQGCGIRAAKVGKYCDRGCLTAAGFGGDPAELQRTIHSCDCLE